MSTSIINDINQWIDETVKYLTPITNVVDRPQRQSRPAGMSIKQWYQYQLVQYATYGSDIEYIIDTLEGTDSLCTGGVR